MKLLHFILLLSIGSLAYGQELPPIENFSSSDYDGDNQNWMISQGNNNFIYVANNKGLLEYDGSNWKAYQSPNNTLLRSVKVIKDKIYTGCYEEFGYWQKDDFGILQYTSLIPKLKNSRLTEDQIWNILDFNGWVLFQSSHALYFYNELTDKMKIITSKSIIYKVFNTGNQIFYHVADEGIYCIKNGQSVLVCKDSIILNDRVIAISEHKNKVLVLTRNSGFFEMDAGVLKEKNSATNQALKEYNIFNSLKLADGGFILGTISNGILKMDTNGQVEYVINRKNGLANNTVLSLFEDKENNVWAGLDNGISCINVKSPIKTFIDYKGELGTVYATIVFKNKLYVGTNQGLFYKSLTSTSQKLRFIKGTTGQVWSLYNYDDQVLFCGHHLGTFTIQDNVASKISAVLGAWDFRRIPSNKNLILQGNYDGLYILDNIKGRWEIRNKIKGFNNSSRYFEINNSNTILVNHEYKGVYGLKLDSALTRVVSYKNYTNISSGKNSSLITHNNKILYKSSNGVYSFNAIEDDFEKDSTLSTMVKQAYSSGKMIVDKTGKLWMFSKDHICYIQNNNITSQPEMTNIPVSAKLKAGVLGFENLNLLSNETYIVGTSNGYLTLDISKLKSNDDNTIYLNAIKNSTINSEINYLPLSQSTTLEHKQGIISFNYSVPQYNKYLDVSYQYKLIGQTDAWSSWSKNSNVQFENLYFGDYEILARAKVGNKLSKNTVSYSFKVKRPWYISNVAILLYLLILGSMGFLIHRAYKLYYARILKHEQIKNEKTLIQIKNKTLNHDIESKNRELAISTMSIIKKNELLAKIKKKLKKSSNTEDIKSAINLIDTNLNNNKDWKFFKQAFNNVDKDFLDKIKLEHPDLTPNDLRFCAYLRLNLSSKEIAPLLNISTKSVETKRYRLRKRLKLNHDDSLVNYILKF